jgi:hypothetical protein
MTDTNVRTIGSMQSTIVFAQALMTLSDQSDEAITGLKRRLVELKDAAIKDYKRTIPDILRMPEHIPLGPRATDKIHEIENWIETKFVIG